MNLPDAAAEFARQLAAALAGETGREQRVWREDVEHNAARAEQAEAKLAHIARDWHRIEELVGREFTSPESTIDRVATLVAKERELSDIVKVQAAEKIVLYDERDELMRAASDLITACDAGNPGSRVREMAALLARLRGEKGIDKGSTAEVCVDRAERERDELLAAVDDVQRDPSVPVIGSVRRLVELAGTIRRRLR